MISNMSYYHVLRTEMILTNSELGHPFLTNNILLLIR